MSAALRERVAAGMLAKLPLFRGVSRHDLGGVVREARMLNIARGQSIAGRGEPVPGLLTVVQGMVKLTLRGASGTERVLRLVGPLQTFGEAVLFLHRPLPVDAVAVIDTRLLVMPEAPLLALLDRDPHFARSLVLSLCQNMHELVCDFEATTMHGAAGRLATYLDSLALTPGATKVTLPAAKKLIAARLGMTKETFSRALRELAQDGLVAVAGRNVALLDRERLGRAGRH